MKTKFVHFTALASVSQVLGFSRFAAIGQARRITTLAANGFGGSATRVDPAVASLALSYFVDDKVIL
jgi:hypothetical protein